MNCIVSSGRRLTQYTGRPNLLGSKHPMRGNWLCTFSFYLEAVHYPSPENPRDVYITYDYMCYMVSRQGGTPKMIGWRI
jgi:hypothetical protein